MTYLHDYRLLCAEAEPTVVGGQAVALWAISYLEASESAELLATKYGSKDMDILADSKVLAHLKTAPGWVFRPNSTKNWTDTRIGFLHSVTPDGRKLLVEVLHNVHGLEQADFAHVETVNYAGVNFKVLDPVVMLQAKAANVRDIKQDDTPPRHDREHLQLIARCVPLYLEEVHQTAVAQPTMEKQALSVVSRAFKVLQHVKTAETLRAEGIKPAELVPAELMLSPLERIRRAYEYQMPLIESQQQRRGYRI